MKKILSMLCLIMACSTAYCQEHRPHTLSFSASVLGQAFSIPLASPAIYRRNPGLSLAALYPLTPKAAVQQQLELGFFFNRYHGSTYMLSTSTFFYPVHTKWVKAGISLGAGYMNSGFSRGGWEQNAQGEWVSSANRKGNVFVPAALQLQLTVYSNDRIALAPLLSYQLNALIRYSHAAVVLPQSLLKAGLFLSLY